MPRALKPDACQYNSYLDKAEPTNVDGSFHVLLCCCLNHVASLFILRPCRSRSWHRDPHQLYCLSSIKLSSVEIHDSTPMCQRVRTRRVDSRRLRR